MSTWMNKNDIANKKVAMYFNMASVSPSIELHTALMHDLLSRGNRIVVYRLGKSFKSPTENPFNRWSIRRFSAFRVRAAVAGSDVEIKTINLRNVSSQVPPEIYETLELGVMSSFASATKANTKADLNRKWRRAYDRMVMSACKLYNYFARELRDGEYDFISMFNGRFGDVKPALEAAKTTHTGFILNEVKKTINEVVFVNELVHSIDGNTRRAQRHYARDKEHARQEAADFFEKKMSNESTGDPIYTKFQSRGELPDAVLTTDKKIIAVYPTTEDEYKYIGKEWDGHVPESQVDEIDALARTLDPDKYLIVVKMHPNQANSAEQTLEKYMAIAAEQPHVVVEPPLSKKDTYALMRVADVVVTFASTIGVEACYFGKPVILIGDTTWSKMNVAHNVYSGTAAGELITAGVDPKPTEGALVWGSYLLSYKDTLPGYNMEGPGEYTFRGKKIGMSRFWRIMQLPAKFEIEVSRPGFAMNKFFLQRIKSILINIMRGKWGMR